jgi:hypothetical protein
VQALAEKLGEYKYPPAPHDNVKRVLKEAQTQENGATYFGFWY